VIARQNDIFGRCMYCHDSFGLEDKWKVIPFGFTNYVSVVCSSCHREHRFKDPNVHTIEDVIEKLSKKNN
jgi:hypothetical protein